MKFFLRMRTQSDEIVTNFWIHENKFIMNNCNNCGYCWILSKINCLNRINALNFCGRRTHQYDIIIAIIIRRDLQSPLRRLNLLSPIESSLTVFNDLNVFLVVRYLLVSLPEYFAVILQLIVENMYSYKITDLINTVPPIFSWSLYEFFKASHSPILKGRP